eukprot:5883295-Prymnesium_polylepis.1
MCRYPIASALRTASYVASPGGTRKTPSPSKGISLPSLSFTVGDRSAEDGSAPARRPAREASARTATTTSVSARHGRGA